METESNLKGFPAGQALRAMLADSNEAHEPGAQQRSTPGDAVVNRYSVERAKIICLAFCAALLVIAIALFVLTGNTEHLARMVEAICTAIVAAHKK